MYLSIRLSDGHLRPEQSTVECRKRYLRGCEPLTEKLYSMEFVRYKGLCSYPHIPSGSWLLLCNNFLSRNENSASKI
jgi:hypothetical protein